MYEAVKAVNLAVWKTGHPIADRVAHSVFWGFEYRAAASMLDTAGSDDGDVKYIINHDAHIAYGILRGTAGVFRECDRQGKPWIHLDRGYFGASHFDGTYRISLRGTQQTSNWPEPSAHNVELKPWRGFDHSKPVLVVPPTEAVQQFLGLEGWPHPEGVVKLKDGRAVNFQDYNYVYTFNSSLGWQAIAAGIPCVSNPTHSMVGAWYERQRVDFSLDELARLQYLDRERLFGTMSSLQMTLQEIEQGKLWTLVEFMLASITANPSPAT